MSGDKQEYDLICSLGGNCSAAHNLLIRNLRPFALPFDWTYFTSDEAVYQLAKGFKDGFSNYMRKENLKELPINPSHPNRIQYEDTYGKIIWANHFLYKKNRDKEYAIVKKKFDKRFKRLLNLVQKSNKILFLFSVSYETNIEAYTSLLKELKNIYPQKEIDIKIISFACSKDEIIKQENIELYKYRREKNLYDFNETNFEWNFLDNIKIKERKKFFKIEKSSTHIYIYILPFFITLFYIKFYILGKRIHFYIGKYKYE